MKLNFPIVSCDNLQYLKLIVKLLTKVKKKNTHILSLEYLKYIMYSQPQVDFNYIHMLCLLVTFIAVYCVFGQGKVTEDQMRGRDPNEYNWKPLFEDDATGCNNHNLRHFTRNVNTVKYQQWNQRVLGYVPTDKDSGPMRYFVEAESAPIPTMRSPKLSSCVKVRARVHLNLSFFVFTKLFFFFVCEN